MRISCVIPTYNGEATLGATLQALLSSTIVPEIWIIDSSSKDRTCQIAKEFGIKNIIVIPKEQFNHGLTREMGRKKAGCDIVLFLTQDAELATSNAIERLIQPLINDEAAIAYARQIPRKSASFIEKEVRRFNYPEKSQLRSQEDLTTMGASAFFCSNSCAAWRQEALDSIGGFHPLSFGEDAEACLRLLLKGYKVAYVADSEVLHSHEQTLLEEYRRNRLIGQSRKVLFSQLDQPISDSGRGKALAKQLFFNALRFAPWMLPKIGAYLATRWLGYKKGLSDSSF